MKPFLKWAGGKQNLLPELLRFIPDLTRARYHEPFLGGGSLFFSLCYRGLLGKKKSRLSDVNSELICTYQVVRDHLDKLISLLKTYRNTESDFYRIRALLPEKLETIERAARFIYLNKTCFNGLYRENKQGRFNVSFGHYSNPPICDEPTLTAAHDALQKVAIECSSFEETLWTIHRGDFVYFDPPYPAPSGDRKENFIHYHAQGFTGQQHVSLAKLASTLISRGTHVLVSNADLPVVHELYEDFLSYPVLNMRNVASRPTSRGKIQELLLLGNPAAFPINSMVQSSEKPILIENIHTIPHEPIRIMS